MKSETASGRLYRMTARAEAADRTRRAVLDAMVGLWRERPLDRITLADVAARANVSVRTVIRRFGSREGVIAACMQDDAGGVLFTRTAAAGSGVDAALDALFAHYETDGDAVLRTLELEAVLPEAAAMAAAGRAVHRRWCERVFADRLPPARDQDRDARLDAFVAATDLCLWKLLRRDFGRSKETASRTMRLLVHSLISADDAARER